MQQFVLLAIQSDICMTKGDSYRYGSFNPCSIRSKTIYRQHMEYNSYTNYVYHYKYSFGSLPSHCFCVMYVTNRYFYSNRWATCMVLHSLSLPLNGDFLLRFNDSYCFGYSNEKKHKFSLTILVSYVSFSKCSSKIFYSYRIEKSNTINSFQIKVTSKPIEERIFQSTLGLQICRLLIVKWNRKMNSD